MENHVFPVRSEDGRRRIGAVVLRSTAVGWTAECVGPGRPRRNKTGPVVIPDALAEKWLREERQTATG